MPTVITAIANPEAEGFVAGTLYAQGWNVVFRAIDWGSLQSYLTANSAISVALNSRRARCAMRATSSFEIRDIFPILPASYSRI